MTQELKMDRYDYRYLSLIVKDFRDQLLETTAGHITNGPVNVTWDSEEIRIIYNGQGPRTR